MAISFSGTARSERHFTALLLPHLLMSNNFAGARALFRRLGLDSGQAPDSSDIEIVAELNPIRDVVGRVTDGNTADSEKHSQVVPDLFIRIGGSALVIEAKFFTHPSGSDVAAQLCSQRDAIEAVRLQHTEYARCSFHYLALTVLPLDDVAEWPNDSSRMTWSEIISVLEPVVGTKGGADAGYSLEMLKNAVERSRGEADTSSNEKGRAKSIEDLMEKAITLLKSGYRYVGFIDGEQALRTATVEYLEKRHYKYSDCQPNKNWLPLHSVISHYLKLKAEEHADSNV